MTLVLYVHGRGGSAAESEHYKALFPDCEVVGVDYRANTPREAVPEIQAIVRNLSGGYDDIILIANSIGAFFSMHAEIGGLVREAFFISPVVDLEKMFGIELMGSWLDFVRSHPLEWDVPTHILFGRKDRLIPFETISEFVGKHDASLTVMENGEHWFHTEEQMQFLDDWIRGHRSPITSRDIWDTDAE